MTVLTTIPPYSVQYIFVQNVRSWLEGTAGRYPERFSAKPSTLLSTSRDLDVFGFVVDLQNLSILERPLPMWSRRGTMLILRLLYTASG